MAEYTRKASIFMLARIREIPPTVAVFLMETLRLVRIQQAEASGRPLKWIGLVLVRRAWALVSWFRRYCGIDAATDLQDVQLRIAAEMVNPTNAAKIRGLRNHFAFLTIVASALVVLYRYEMPQAA